MAMVRLSPHGESPFFVMRFGVELVRAVRSQSRAGGGAFLMTEPVIVACQGGALYSDLLDGVEKNVNDVRVS